MVACPRDDKALIETALRMQFLEECLQEGERFDNVQTMQVEDVIPA